MVEPQLNFLALSYRIVYTIMGSYIAARSAPRNPMRHAMILGAIGFVLSIPGVIIATQANLGPMWYPIALVITALPCAWLGGLLYQTKHSAGKRGIARTPQNPDRPIEGDFADGQAG